MFPRLPFFQCEPEVSLVPFWLLILFIDPVVLCCLLTCKCERLDRTVLVADGQQLYEPQSISPTLQ